MIDEAFMAVDTRDDGALIPLHKVIGLDELVDAIRDLTEELRKARLTH